MFMNLVWFGAVASQLLPLLLEGLNGGVHLSVVGSNSLTLSVVG